MGHDYAVEEISAMRAENERLEAERAELVAALRSIIAGEFGQFDAGKVAQIAGGTYWDKAAALLAKLGELTTTKETA